MGPKKRLFKQTTKNFNCPATVVLREMLGFPNHKVTHNISHFWIFEIIFFARQTVLKLSVVYVRIQCRTSLFLRSKLNTLKGTKGAKQIQHEKQYWTWEIFQQWRKHPRLCVNPRDGDEPLQRNIDVNRMSVKEIRTRLREMKIVT